MRLLQVASRPDGGDARAGQQVQRVFQGHVTIVAGVVVGQAEHVQARVGQGNDGGRIGAESIALGHAGAAVRERALEVTKGDIRGRQSSLDTRSFERVQDALALHVLTHIAGQHDVTHRDEFHGWRRLIGENLA